MDRVFFKNWANTSRVILDGASGTQMQAEGVPNGVSLELFTLEHPEILQRIQRRYYEAGSDIVYTFTFGSNRIKLSHYGIEQKEVKRINQTLATISCQVRDAMRSQYPDRQFYVAGDLAPTGEFLVPAGNMTFEELVDIYKEQVVALAAGGVDLFVIETMMDLAQTRAALIAIREMSDLPVIATLTFDHGRTLSGNTPEACLIALESLGADAVGANCSTGPKEMLSTLSKLRDISSLPLVAKPNAGMPEIVDGKTVFPMNSIDFGIASSQFLEQGITVIGGCCGTTPEHIAALYSAATGDLPITSHNRLSGTTSFSNNIITTKSSDIAQSTKISNITKQCISSFCRISIIGTSTVFATIQYKNPEKLAEDIADAADEEPDCILIEFPISCATITEELSAIYDVITMIGMTVHVPIGIRTTDSILLEMIARIYTGRLLYSEPGQQNEKIKGIITKYGVLSIG